jgi:dolichol-phosphate mannosyltransferase
MYRGLKFIVIAPCFNEQEKIAVVVERLKATGLPDEIVVVDDGSNDGSADAAKTGGATVLKMGKVCGVGAALRYGFEYAKKRCDVIVVIAGNNKDNPDELPRLLDPIVDGEAIFVQGSRFLRNGGYGGDMPFYRKIATRVHPLLFSLVTGKWVTESTNGYRAFRVSLLDDKRIFLAQSWLNEYELEPYLYYKTIALGYPTKEVPVTKIYPPKKLGYTKMKPVTGWWSILRPLILLRLGMRS